MSAVCSTAPPKQRQTPPASGYYQVHTHAGRWAVTYPLPGMPGCFGGVMECATQAAAELEAARMNQERTA
jgi:hypothetical protein